MGECELMDKKTVCELLKISSNTFLRMCNKGTLPAVKIGKRWYVPAAKMRELVGVC